MTSQHNNRHKYRGRREIASRTPHASAEGPELLRDARRALVLGAGRSGISAALALVQLGLEVTLSDRRPAESIGGLDDAARAGVRFMPEQALESDWPRPDLVIKSPGVPGESRPVSLAYEYATPVWSELELAYALLPNPFVVVTGTNGKTTTTALLGHLFSTAGRPARVLGNIGVPVTSVIGDVEAEEELVVEASSFQLEDVHFFRPQVGVFLNFTPDHLDRHLTLERYLACKAALFANQGTGDVAVLNLADPFVAGLGLALLARAQGPEVMFFSRLGSDSCEVRDAPAILGWGDRDGAARRPAGCFRPAAWVESGQMFIQGEPVLPIADIRLPGAHNLENCLAAGSAAAVRGIAKEAIAEGLRTFAGVPHRLETAGMVAGVTYVNDSKATNVEAALTALNAFPERTHLILGGRDKGSDYRPLARASARGCRAVYLIGEAAPLIEEAFAEVREREGLQNLPEVQICGDLEAAVAAAAAQAIPGDVVLLAPACASFDQYQSFEHRGLHFRELVTQLQRKGS